MCISAAMHACISRNDFYCTSHAAKYGVAERMERCASTSLGEVGDPHAGDRGALDLQVVESRSIGGVIYRGDLGLRWATRE
jgi:hypothetical protein